MLSAVQGMLIVPNIDELRGPKETNLLRSQMDVDAADVLPNPFGLPEHPSRCLKHGLWLNTDVYFTDRTDVGAYLFH